MTSPKLKLPNNLVFQPQKTARAPFIFELEAIERKKKSPRIPALDEYLKSLRIMQDLAASGRLEAAVRERMQVGRGNALNIPGVEAFQQESLAVTQLWSMIDNLLKSGNMVFGNGARLAYLGSPLDRISELLIESGYGKRSIALAGDFPTATLHALDKMMGDGGLEQDARNKHTPIVPFANQLFPPQSRIDQSGENLFIMPGTSLALNDQTGLAEVQSILIKEVADPQEQTGFFRGILRRRTELLLRNGLMLAPQMIPMPSLIEAGINTPTSTRIPAAQVS